VDGKGKYGFLDIETGTLTLKNINIKNFVDKCVYTVDTNLNIENCVFTNNNARERGGGAIYHHNRAYATKNLNIANSKFYNNKANNGGAVFTFGTAKTNVVNSLFDGNVAKNNGGAMVTDIGYRFTSPSSTKIDGSVFSNNKASNGGAIYQEVPLYVSNSKFINNHADKEAGAIYRNAKFEQDNVLFKNNTPQDFEYTGGADDYDEPTSNPSYRAYSTNYRSIDKITVNNRQIQIIDNKLTLDVLNQIFNKDFRNGHLIVYIDGILVFNATTTDDLLQVIFDLLNLLSGNHEIKVVFTDSNGNTNTYVENITI
jgi:predicted outer membrane repeat protein